LIMVDRIRGMMNSPGMVLAPSVNVCFMVCSPFE
jgi:hypothetical protein